MTNQLLTVDVTVPPDFPDVPYNAIHRHCQPRMSPKPPNGPVWDEYAYAWNAVAYRFRALADHSEAFIAALTAERAENRYIQERELFGFFVCGLSTIESCCYGLYHLAAVSSPAEFPTADRRAIDVARTVTAFAKSHRSEAVSSHLKSLSTNATYLEWGRVRNVLAHRGAPGRKIIGRCDGSGVKDDDIWKIEDISLNTDTTTSRRQWLSETLTEILVAANGFVQRTLP